MFGQDDQNDDISTVNPTLDSGDGSATSAPVAVPTDAPAVDTPAAAPIVEAVPATEPVIETPVAPAEPATVTEEPTTDDKPASLEDTELLSLKEEALKELAPLLDQLDQSPGEKFKTTMMMIQATDDASLVKSAHETALKITDEKVRAQALLDVVNEINYFTQPKE